MSPDPRDPVYALRSRGHNLLADSLGELTELIECAHRNDDHIELLLAYYPSTRQLDLTDLAELAAALNHNR